MVGSEGAGFPRPIEDMTLVVGDLAARGELGDTPLPCEPYRADLVRIATSHDGVLTLPDDDPGFVAAFPSARGALEAASALQRAFAADGAANPHQLRLGIHTGEVELPQHPCQPGETVQRAIAIRDAGHGGQVLLSGSTRALAGPPPPCATFVDRGTQRLRDLMRPEHLWELQTDDRPADSPPLRSLDRWRHNLPTSLTPFLGRARERREVGRALSRSALVTIVGPGGAGKTRLALQATADALDRFTGGAWFVDLTAIRDGGPVLDAVAEVVGAADVDAEAGASSIARTLGPDPTLLVLDNCEHLIDDAAEAAAALLRRQPALTVLATSREPLDVPGEIVWRIPPLSQPPSSPSPRVDELARSDALRLFRAAARRARPNFRPGDHDVMTMAHICTRLDGIPLALELAASRLRSTSLQEIAAGLDDRFRLLGAGPRTVLPRQQTLRASVDWSYQLLEHHDRLLLRRLAVFGGAVDGASVVAVCGFPPLDPRGTADGLDRLVDRSLVVRDDTTTPATFRLMETIRQFAAEQLAATDPGAEGDLRQRHLQHLLDLSKPLAGAMDDGDGVAMQRLVGVVDRLRDDIAPALLWAERRDRGMPALELFARLGPLWQRRPATGRRHLARLMVLGGDVPQPLRLRMLLAGLLAAESHPDLAIRLAEEALELAVRIGDGPASLRAKSELGVALCIAGESIRGHALLEEVLADTSSDDRPAAWAAEIALAGEAYQMGEPARCKEIVERLLPATKAAFPRSLPLCLAILAIAELSLGEPHRMRSLLDQASRLDVGDDPAARSDVLLRYQALELAVGDVDACIARCQEQLALHDDVQAAPATRLHLSLCALATGDLEEAAEQLRLGAREMVDAGYGELVLAAPKAELLRRRGQLVAARELLDDALRWTTSSRDRLARRHLLLLRARVALDLSDVTGAEDVIQEAASFHAETGIVHGLPDVLEEIAAIDVQRGDLPRAARLYGASAGIRATTGLARVPYIPEHAHESDAFVSEQARPPHTELVVALGEGRHLTAAEAITYARRGRGERKRPAVGWSALTPAELEVVRLVAQHLTNPQIAARLFMSRNTVKTHLSHVFDKLGVASRSALAAEATRRGLGPSS